MSNNLSNEPRRTGPDDAGRETVEVAIVGGNVQLAIDGKVIKAHPIRHDPIKEHGAFANPGGRPPKKHSA